jgi:methionyl aminopeptidase
LARYGARSAPAITYNYPAVTCISVNDEAAHGIPGERIIQAGDLVKLDVSAELHGYFADAAITVPVQPIAPDILRLVDCARVALEQALKAARSGQPLNRIGHATETYVRGKGYTIIRELPGHGVGAALHEEPSVFNHYIPHDSQRLREGLVITIEPHVTRGKGHIKTDKDGWTLRTTDRKLVANFEHTIMITPQAPLVLTAI